MDSDILSALLLGACALCCGAGVLWQVLRRKPAAARRVDRVGGRPRPKVAVPKPEEKPLEKPSVGVLRPDMLAFVTGPGDATNAEVFVQRAFEADLPWYREVELEAHDKKEFDGFFAHNAALAREVGDGLSEDTYAVSFSPVIESAVASGYEPHVNATSNDVAIIALRCGTELGETMSSPDYSWGGQQAVLRLYDLLTPSEQRHALDGELRNELAHIEGALPKMKLLLSALRGHEWQTHWEELFDLSRDVRRLGLEEGRAQERIARADDLAEAMRAVNRRIDARFDELYGGMKDADAADAALTEAVALTDEREMAVLFLRAIALMRVISSEDYVHGMRCSSRIAKNVEAFPDVHRLLDRARHLALDALEVESRGMTEAEMRLVADVRKDADRLATEHEKVTKRLRKDVARLQEAIDRHLILQGRRRRFAVRMNAENEVAALLVLEH